MVPLYAFIHSYIHIANIFSKFSAVLPHNKVDLFFIPKISTFSLEIPKTILKHFNHFGILVCWVSDL